MPVTQQTNGVPMVNGVRPRHWHLRRARLSPKTFPFRFQAAVNDCGVACAISLCEYYGIGISISNLRERLATDPGCGTAIGQFSISLRDIFSVQTGKQPPGKIDPAAIPFIAYLPKQRHFVIVWAQDQDGRLTIGDPTQGIITMRLQQFTAQWEGISIILRPLQPNRNGVHLLTRRSSLEVVRNLFAGHRGEFVALAIPATILGMVNALFSAIFPYYLLQYPKIISMTAGYSLLALSISSAVAWMSNWLKKRYCLRIGQQLRCRVERLDPRFYTSGDFFTRFQDIENIVGVVIQLARDLPYTVIIFACAVGYLLFVSWKLAFAILAAVGILIGLVRPLVRRVREYVYEIRLRMARLSNETHQFWHDAQTPIWEGWEELLMTIYRQGTWKIPLSTILGQTATLGLIGVILFAREGAHGLQGYAPLISMISIMTYLTSAATDLYQHYLDWQLAQPAVHRLDDFLEVAE